MKHKLHILFAIAVILMGLTACQKSTKDKLVGTWKVVDNISGSGYTSDIQYIQTNNENGTSSFKGRMVITYPGENEDDMISKVSIAFSGTSKWIIKEDEIVDSPLSANVKFENIKFYDPSDNSFLGSPPKSEAEKCLRELVSELKNGFMEASTERILMIDKNRYVTESTDDDGIKSTTTYNRIK